MRKFPQLFELLPQLNFQMKKLQIYDLISKELLNESKNHYIKGFAKHFNKANFKRTKDFFNLLLNYEKRSEIVKKYYNAIMSEFFDDFENDLIELLSKYSRMYLKRNENIIIIEDNDSDIDDYLLFDTEESIMQLLLSFNDSAKFYYWQLSHLFGCLQNQSNNFEVKYKNFILQNNPVCDKPNIEENNVVMECKMENQNNECNSNLNTLDKNDVLMLKDKYSNFNLQRKKSTKKSMARKKFKFTNDFLRKFSPKFMKKENLDKRIIRRFKKYLIEKLISIGVIKLKERNDKFLNNDDAYIVIDDRKSLKFAINFATKNTIPPFKSKDISFKSISCDYLKWVFSDHLINKIYEEFKVEYGKYLKEELVDNYSLKQKEPNIIEPLEKYIGIMNIFYSKNVIEENLSENDFKTDYSYELVEKLNTVKIENVKEKCLNIRRNRLAKNKITSKKSTNSDLSNIRENAIDNHSTDCSQNFISNYKKKNVKNENKINQVFSVKKVYKCQKNIEVRRNLIDNSLEKLKINRMFHENINLNSCDNDYYEVSKSFIDTSCSHNYGYDMNYSIMNEDYSQKEMSMDDESNASTYKDYETFFN